MRWTFRDSDHGVRNLWEQWPHWFQAIVVLAIIAFMTPALVTMWHMAISQ